MTNQQLIDELENKKVLTFVQWKQLIGSFTNEDRIYAAQTARKIAKQTFGNRIYYRGIIEFTNICKNDCLYCGIRKSNANASRYRLTKDEILLSCDLGYKLGFRTFVLQGGEDLYYSDERMEELVGAIKHRYPDCAITLSIGERSFESYKKLYDAGASRFLLRHETADELHYAKLHPPALSWRHRMQCLYDLKAIGYQTGCGCMVGSPYQTVECLVKDMQFISEFKPEMIGIGPFIPHKDTPFCNFETGSTETTLFLLSLCRIALPNVLLPATTALGTVQNDGRQLGILAGANVIMPNLSPIKVRKKYMLYNNKIGVSDDTEQTVRYLDKQMKEIGYELIIDKGDYNEEDSRR